MTHCGKRRELSTSLEPFGTITNTNTNNLAIEVKRMGNATLNNVKQAKTEIMPQKRTFSKVISMLAVEALLIRLHDCGTAPLNVTKS